ncbi:MAG TPA: Fic family protein [Longimicrobiales bacterium]|nr:Fic family protein [Longimicrobiales bacterium]
MARPTKAEIDRQLDVLQAAIEQHPEGIGQREIGETCRAGAGWPLDERTLQRRLNLLVQAGRVRAAGETRARRYFPEETHASEYDARRKAPTDAQIRGAMEPTEDEAFHGIPLSSGAADALGRIRLPIVARRPVGYDEAFLRDYEPGRSWYLSSTLRGQLHEIGRTPDPDRAAGTFARDIFERLLIDLAWASSRLEGNTYDRLDTRNLLEHGVRAEGKDAADAQMILNHKKAIEMLVEQAGEIDFNRHTFLNLHAALSENLVNDARDEGRLRTRMVHITGTTFTPLAIPQKLEELFDLLLTRARAIPDPFEQAFFVMVHLPYLQPFTDVNKRTSRLGANLPLIKANLCPLSFIDVPERAYIESTLALYEGQRIEPLRDLFVWAYERSCEQYRVTREALGQPDPIRLRYRNELGDVVRETVLALRPPRRTAMRDWAQARNLPGADLDAFSDAALGLLLDLHEGALARYGLRPSDLERWKKTMEPA